MNYRETARLAYTAYKLAANKESELPEFDKLSVLEQQAWEIASMTAIDNYLKIEQGNY